jgi:hypothetical protein
MYSPNEHLARDVLGYYAWLSPLWVTASPLFWFRDHTQTHHIQWDSSGRVIGPPQRPLSDNKQHSQCADIHASGGIRTRRPQQATGRKPTPQTATPPESALFQMAVKYFS